MIKETTEKPFECRFPVTRKGDPFKGGFTYHQLDGTMIGTSDNTPGTYVKQTMTLASLTEPEQNYLMKRMVEIEDKLNQIRNLSSLPDINYIGKNPYEK